MGVSLCFLFAANLLAADLRSVPISSGLTARLTSDYDIILVVEPHKGDAWTRLARRVTGDASRWRELAAANKLGEQLTTDARVTVPLSSARAELQLAAVRALFREDAPTARGWRHKVAFGSASEGEPLWKIAEWFTGKGENYTAIRAANKELPLVTARGTTVVIPEKLLAPAFRATDENRGASKQATDVKKTGKGEQTAAAPETALPLERDPEALALTKTSRRSSDEETAASLVRLAASKADVVPQAKEKGGLVAADEVEVVAPAARHDELTFVREGDKEYAVYRLKKGEALYSSVVSRFTGRVYAKDVSEVLAKIVEVNQISDVARIYVDEPIRIPIEYVAEEYLPTSNERRLAYERSKRASAQAARRVGAKNLEGVRIVIDPGHGGRDVGTVHEDVWESNYVYDVACRLKRLIEKKSSAKVHLTTRSADYGYDVQEKDVLDRRNDHVVLTNPKYILDDPVVGVNLRWYLANSLFRRAVEKKVTPEKVIFISIHADSLHPSLRGAMAYIPGQRFAHGTFAKKGKIYLARDEVRESPLVKQTEEEALRAEGLSRKLAEAIIDSMSDAHLAVHPFNPVREHVIRDGKEWVPAIIRYNKIPTRLLLEICNLGNATDRELVQTREFRQKLAKSIYDGIVNFYDSDDAPVPAEPKLPATLTAAAK